MTRRLSRAAVLLAALAALIVIGPGVHAGGSFEEVRPLDLGLDEPKIGLWTRGELSENINGYRVQPGGQAVVFVPLALPDPSDGRTLLRIWAYGPQGVRTTAVLRSADGTDRPLGTAGNWTGRLFDVSREARGSSATLRIRAENSTDQPVLFLDRVAPVAASGELRPDASWWSVGLLVLLVASALLAAFGRLARHWPLPALLGAVAAAVWSEVTQPGISPVTGASTWNLAARASWFGIDDGLLSGSWTGFSSLAVQVFHAWTPLVGAAPASARAAALLTALVALAALYALAFRATGPLGALVAALLGVAALDVSNVVGSASIVPVLVLAAALFGYALHACLARATATAIALLGASAALLLLADPAWLPGAVAAVLVVAVVCAERGDRLRIARIGLLAVVAVSLPHITSTASQHDGRLFEDLRVRATAARNIEFVGQGHGAPTPEQYARDPLAGRPVTLTRYLLGDHSPTELAGGVLTGARESIAAFGSIERPRILGTVVLVVMVTGVLFVLLLDRLRMLALLALLVAAPTLFIASRTGSDPVAAGAVLLPAMVTSAAILVHAVGRLAGSALAARLPDRPATRIGPRLPALRRRATKPPPSRPGT